jgi:DNA-directed RNA polymerase specialized sigma24 family protein
MITSLARKAYAQRAHQTDPFEESPQPCELEQRVHAQALIKQLERILDGFAPAVRALFQLIATGCTVRDASLQLGLAPTTGHRWFHRVRAQLELINDQSAIF